MRVEVGGGGQVDISAHVGWWRPKSNELTRLTHLNNFYLPSLRFEERGEGRCQHPVLDICLTLLGGVQLLVLALNAGFLQMTEIYAVVGRFLYYSR
jgi:hypothetical protein